MSDKCWKILAVKGRNNFCPACGGCRVSQAHPLTSWYFSVLFFLIYCAVGVASPRIPDTWSVACATRATCTCQNLS